MTLGKPLHTVSVSRREVLAVGARGTLAATGAGLLGWTSAARADTYPSKPIRLIVAFPPAGATDILARAISQRMAISLGQQIVIENRPGAGGTIGLDIAARSPADGYNAYFCAMTNQAIAEHLYPKAAGSLVRDFDPVGLVANGAHMLNVHPSVPARTVSEFVAWLKANDGKVNYASQGNGTLSHLETELLSQRIGVRLVHVPYKGSSGALPDLIAGNVSFMFDSVAASMPHVKSGALRALGVAATQRLPILPDLSTIAEGGVPGYDVDNWFGVYLPKGSPESAITRLNDEITKALANPELQTLLGRNGFASAHGPASRLAQVTAQEIEKWGRVVKSANVRI